MTEKPDGGPQPASAVRMAAHLCFDRAYLATLVSQGVLKQRSDGKFDFDARRRAYIEFLREARKRSPKSEADFAFTRAKAELLQLRIGERKKEPRFVVWCSIQLSYGRLGPPRAAKASPARGRALAAFGEAGKAEPR